MTEGEWLAANTHEGCERMLRLVAARLRPGALRRKFRLLLCGHWRLRTACEGMEDSAPAYRWVIDLAERYADGAATEEELAQARRAVEGLPEYRHNCEYYYYPCHVAHAALGPDCPGAEGVVSQLYALTDLAYDPHDPHPFQVVRDLLGNPFRPVHMEPPWLAWEAGTVVRLAQGIYQASAFARLPILADALEEAGCASSELLDHLRSPGPHARGCWALDRVTGWD